MRLYIRVKGRVQGIGYRFFVVQEAKKLSLSGWVRNCPDGDVECEAQGAETKVSSFLNQIETGHSWARVDKIQKEEVKEKNADKGFEIQY